MTRFEDMFKLDEEQAINSESAAKLTEAITSARKCLNHGDFQKYKESYESAYENILNDMCFFTDNYIFRGQGSIEMYAMKMVQYIQRIQDLKILLNKIKLDSSKTIKEN